MTITHPLDLQSVIFTLVVAPLVIGLALLAHRFLQHRIMYLAEGVAYYAGGIFDRRIAAFVSLRQYARAQLSADWSRYLRVPGASQLLATDEMYIPLAFESNLLSHQSTTNPELFASGQRLVIIGEPGSGKTTLIKSLHREESKASLTLTASSQLPVILELKKLKPKKGMTAEQPLWMLDELRNLVLQTSGYSMRRLFDTFYTNRGLRIFLDGLDEVSSAFAEEVLLGIESLVPRLQDESPKSRLVLTMRTQYFSQVSERLGQVIPVTLRVQPFNMSDVYDFLSKWPFDAQSKAASIARIFEQLQEAPALKDLCTNPLVLTMFVVRDEGPGGSAPDTRSAFYSTVTEELLVRRRQGQLKLKAITALLSKRQAFFGELAERNLTNREQGANAVTWEDASTVYRKVFQSRKIDLDSELLTLISETGVMSVAQDHELLHFNHLTFCEFFAALEFTERGDSGFAELIAHHNSFSNEPGGRSRLRETIPFAAAMTRRTERADALDRIYAVDDRTLFGECLLETQEYEHDLFSRYLEQESEYLQGVPDAEWDGRWLQRLHLFHRVMMGYEAFNLEVHRRDSIIDSRTFFDKLISGQRQRLNALFVQLAAEDPPTALRLADDVGVDLLSEMPAQVVPSCANAAFLGLLLARLETSSGSLKDESLVLAEAGLRYHVVADRLHSLESPSRLADIVNQIPRRRRWAIKNPVFPKEVRSMYTDCLTVARATIRNKNEDRGAFPCGNIFSRPRPPGRQAPGLIFGVIPIFLGILILGVLVLVFVYWVFDFRLLGVEDQPASQGNTSSPTSILATVLLIVSFVALCWCIMYPYLRASLHRRLMNLVPVGTVTTTIEVWSQVASDMVLRAFMPRSVKALKDLERLRQFGGSNVLGGPS